MLPQRPQVHPSDAANTSNLGRRLSFRDAKVRPGILLWALGIPIPLILLFLLIRGCVG